MSGPESPIVDAIEVEVIVGYGDCPCRARAGFRLQELDEVDGARLSVLRWQPRFQQLSEEPEHVFAARWERDEVRGDRFVAVDPAEIGRLSFRPQNEIIDEIQHLVSNLFDFGIGDRDGQYLFDESLLVGDGLFSPFEIGSQERWDFGRAKAAVVLAHDLSPFEAHPPGLG
jgi:hypothetical protein